MPNESIWYKQLAADTANLIANVTVPRISAVPPQPEDRQVEKLTAMCKEIYAQAADALGLKVREDEPPTSALRMVLALIAAHRKLRNEVAID